MTPISTSVSSAARSTVIAVDNFANPFNVGLNAVLSAGGSATFSIQYSFDDPMDAGYNPATATWQTLTTFSGVTATTNGVTVIPCKALSINCTTYGSGTITLTIMQAGRR